MSRLAVDVDPIALIRNTFLSDIPDPAHAVVLAEMGGAESIVCYLRDDFRTVSERDVRILKEICKSNLNIRCNINADMIRKLMAVKPDMVTFVAPDNTTVSDPQPVDIETYSDTIANLTADLRASDIISSVMLPCDANLVRLAGKLEVDYIELDVRPYTEADDLDAQIAELENINALVLAANKLGMGVNISGGLDQDNIKDLIKIDMLEDIIVGKPLAAKALAIGLEHATRDFTNLL